MEMFLDRSHLKVYKRLFHLTTFPVAFLRGYWWVQLTASVSLFSFSLPSLLVSRGQRVPCQRVRGSGPHQRQRHGAHRSLLRGGEEGVCHQSPALRRHRPCGRLRHPHRHPHGEVTPSKGSTCRYAAPGSWEWITFGCQHLWIPH